MLKSIDLKNKCGSCDHFRQIGDTAQGECLQNPYGEMVVHDPKHPYWIVVRSRAKCRLYNAKPQTNADRIRAMSDEELAQLLYCSDSLGWCHNLPECGELLNTEECIPEEKCIGCLLSWLQQPAKENDHA